MEVILPWTLLALLWVFLIMFASALIYDWTHPTDFNEDFSESPNWDKRVEVEEND